MIDQELIGRNRGFNLGSGLTLLAKAMVAFLSHSSGQFSTVVGKTSEPRVL